MTRPRNGRSLPTGARVGASGSKVFRAVDLFAGIGGIRLGFQQAFGRKLRVVWSNDNDPACCKTYEANFGSGSMFCGDITKVVQDPSVIPQHDILLAGFPCQPFSIAGNQAGFSDKTRGTLFYSIAKILEAKRPEAFLLENVAFFRHHDGGRTWRTVRSVLERDLGYSVYADVLNARDYGLAQNRPRFFMVGFKNRDLIFRFPESQPSVALETVLESKVDNKYYLGQKYLNSLKIHRKRHEALGHGFGYVVLNPKGVANTLVVGGMGKERNLVRDVPPVDCWKEGDEDLSKKNNEGIRRLTIKECVRLQGFPEDFKQVVADTQAYKQFANSVPVSVIRAIATEMLRTLARKSIPPNRMTHWLQVAKTP